MQLDGGEGPAISGAHYRPYFFLSYARTPKRDPTDKTEAIRRVMQSHQKGEVLTGVLYLNTTAPNFIDMINMTELPLATLPQETTRPSREALEECMEALR